VTSAEIGALIERTEIELAETAAELVQLHARRRAEIGLREIGHADAAKFDGAGKAFNVCAERLSKLQDRLESLRIAVSYALVAHLKKQQPAAAAKVLVAEAALVGLEDMGALEARQARDRIRVGLGISHDEAPISEAVREKFAIYRSAKGQLESAAAEQNGILRSIDGLYHQNPGLQELVEFANSQETK